MPAVFDAGGIRFQYPENWALERTEDELGWTVSVQSPATAFMMIYLREDMPSTEELAEAALEGLRGEYADLEMESCSETFAGQPAIGHDIRFFSLDLTNTCWTRSFYTAGGTVLILCQTCDQDDYQAVLKAMCASMSSD